jgi:hypothetical protein
MAFDAAAQICSQDMHALSAATFARHKCVGGGTAN